MKRAKTRRLRRGYVNWPTVAHVVELAFAIVIFAGGQNLFVELVGADPDITPPSVPANLTLSGRSASDVDLSWDASTDDTAVTGYHVYRDGTLVGSPTTTTYDDAGLTPNTTYSYTVSAFDAAANESAQSTALPVTTLADTSPPSTPTNLHQTGSTTSSISIAWNPSTDNVGVTQYEIYRNGSLVRTQAGTSFTDTGLAVFTTYTYTITADDAANNGSLLSQPLYGGTAADVTPPSVPDNLQKTGSTVSSISLSWDASTDDIGVTGYHVYRDGVLVGTPGGTSFTDTGLVVSSNYTYTVSAFDNSGNESAQSAPYDTSSSNDTTPPTTPTSVHTTSVLDSAINIAWTASTDDVGVTGYKVYRDGSLIGTSVGTTYDDSGLSPNTGYTYTVKAYDAASNTSPASAPLITQTAVDTTAPSIPANLLATSKTDTTVTLGWDAATDNIGVTGYDIYRDGNFITSTTGTNYSDGGLAVDTSYTYTVRAHDASGNNSAQSVQLITRTLTDQVAPLAPTGLVASHQTTTSIQLDWNPSSDDVGVVSYNIYRDGNFIANVAGTTFNDTALHYNTSHSYTVTALDLATNESSPSTATVSSTLPDTVAPTVSLDAPGNGASAQLTFLISATASDDLDLNRVEFYVDSTLITTITSAPFAFNWNSYAVHNGAHTITAKAFDASGNFSSQAANITINNPPPPITGDLNGDHKVNILDLSILLSHWNKPGAGDFNNNGKVDIFDLSVLLARYGQDNSNYN